MGTNVDTDTKTGSSTFGWQQTHRLNDLHDGRYGLALEANTPKPQRIKRLNPHSLACKVTEALKKASFAGYTRSKAFSGSVGELWRVQA